MGYNSKPDQTISQVSEVFDKAIASCENPAARNRRSRRDSEPEFVIGEARGKSHRGEEAFKIYYGRSRNAPFKSRAEAMQSPEFAKVFPGAKNRLKTSSDAGKYYEYLIAQDALMTNVLQVMADNKLDAIVHKSVEHQPTLISDGVNPPHVNHRGAPHLNTFLIYVPTIAVPAGFTRDGLPAGISFIGRPYTDGQMLRLAYAYEQATHHRRPPASTS